jgi:O-acetylserine/cysteine efflux transporter
MQFSHLLLAVLVVIIWGFNFVVIQIGLQEIPPFLLCFSRFFLTSLPAIFFIKRPQIPFKILLLYGLAMFVLPFSLLFLGMHAGLSASLASLLLQTQAFFTIFLALLFFKEKMHLLQSIGACIACLGMLIVALNVGQSITLSGLILVIAAAFSWGVGNIISKKIGQANILSLVIWGSLIAWPPLLIASFLTDGTDKIYYTLQHLSRLSSSAILYITYLSTLVGFIIWNFLIRRYPLGTVAPFTLLIPIVGFVSAFLVLGEPLQYWKILAGLLVVLGLTINILGQKSLTKNQK